MLFSIDLLFENIIKCVLEIFNANTFKANDVLNNLFIQLNSDNLKHHINIFMFVKNIYILKIYCIISTWNIINALQISLIYRRNNLGLGIELCGTLHVTLYKPDFIALNCIYCDLFCR